jgi:quercetin dioxygenase-like cupin family protein
MNDRRELFALLGASLLAQSNLGAAPEISNMVFDSKGAQLTREAFGDLRIYFDGPTEQLQGMTAGSLELKPGMTPHPPHTHPEEEIMLLTAGSGEITIEGKKHQCAAGSMMYCAANQSHGIVNTGKTPLTFYFFKWIKRG